MQNRRGVNVANVGRRNQNQTDAQLDVDRHKQETNLSNQRDYDRRGHDRRDYDRRDGGPRDYDRRDYGRRDYDRRDYNRRDYDRRDYDRRDYDRRGYDRRDYGRRDYDRRDDGHRGYDRRDYDRRDDGHRGYDRRDYDRRDYDRRGFDARGSNFQRDEGNVSNDVYSSQGSNKRINAQRDANDRTSYGRENQSGKLFGTRQQTEAPKARKKDLDEGIIVSINGDMGFGFIRSSKEDRDYYFNLRDISRSLLEDMDIGMEVKYEIVKSRSRHKKGELNAVNIAKLPAGSVKWDEVPEEASIVKGVVTKVLAPKRNSDFRRNRMMISDSSGSYGKFTILEPRDEAASGDKDKNQEKHKKEAKNN